MSKARWILGFGAAGTGGTAAALFALGLGMAGGLMWLQTPSGMQNAILPAASWLTGLDIHTRKGRARWSGEVRLVDLRVASPEGWVLNVGEAHFDVEPYSLLTVRPVVQTASLERSRLELRDFDPTDRDHSEHDESQLPIAIQQATVNDATVEVWKKGRLQLRLRDLDLGVDDLEQGGTGRISAAAPTLELAPYEDEAAWAGRVLGFIEVDETTSSGFTWKLSAGAVVWPPDAPDEAVQFDATGTGGATPEQVSGDGSLIATWNGRKEGAVTGDWLWRPASGDVEANLDLAGLGPAFLNPLLATQASVRMDRGLVEGHVALTPAETDVAFTSSLQGHDVVLRALGIEEPTPALQLDSQQTGSWSPETDTFTLATTTVDVRRARTRVATIRLDKPLAFALGEAATGGSDEARLSATMDGVPANELRPWTALFGIPGMEYVDRGVFSGTATAVVRKGGGAIDLDGALDVAQLFLWTDGDAVGPFVVHSTSTAKVTELRHLVIEPSDSRLLSGSSEVALVTTSGTADLETGHTSLTLVVGADDVVSAGRALRLVPDWVEHGKAGRMDAQLSLEAIDSRAPLEVAGSATVGEGGVIGVDGTWPRREGDGRVELALAGLDLAPWFRAWDWVAWPGLTRAPLQGSVIISGRGGNMHIGGRQTLGPMRLPVDATKTERVEIVIEPLFDLTADSAKGQVDLVGSRGGVPTERVHIEASTDLGVQPRFVQGSGRFSDLDLDVYSNTILGLETNDQPTELGDLLTTRMPVDFHLTMELDDVTVWGVGFDSGSCAMRAYGGNLLVNLNPSRFSGGDIEGFVDYRPAGGSPGIEYQVDGKNVDVGKLLAFLDPERDPAMVGQGDLNVHGKGYGRGQALVDDLRGRVDFDVRDGALLRSGLLGYIAKVTTVGQFQGMNFTTLTGRILISGGRATLEDVVARSPRSKLVATGTIDLAGDWTYDVAVQPAVSGGIASGLAHLVGNSDLVGDDGYTLLPMSIVATGPTSALDYAVTRRQGTEEKTGIVKTGGDLLKGVFGLNKKE